MAHLAATLLKITIAAAALTIDPAGRALAAGPFPGEAPAPEAKPGVPPSTRIVEGTPKGGLPYRLTMAAGATEEHPNRLVVWLHPTGGSYNKEAEGMAPLFLKHGLAVLVVTDKSFQGWTDAEAAQLFGRTLPEVSRIAGIDARKPILMGFSGGGQLAIALWRARPGNYGGVILDAAYPIETGDGRQRLMDPPDGGGRSVPLFALVGDRDEVAAAWKKVEEKWKQAGVPLTIRFVPGRGHEWLFGDEETAALDAWLAGPGHFAIVPPQEEPAPAVQP